MPASAPKSTPLSVDVAPDIRLADVLSALSCALDITEGQPEGHSARSCLIAMRIARQIGLPREQASELFYATLLKDSGCSSNAAKVCMLFAADDRTVKRELKTVDWSKPIPTFRYLFRNAAADKHFVSRILQLFKLANAREEAKQLTMTRCSRGADIARKLGFSENTAKAVHSLDEHWDGSGEPLGIEKDAIPLLARIACLAQTAEVFVAEHGYDIAAEVIAKRRGAWFDPELVDAYLAIKADDPFWKRMAMEDVQWLLSESEPEEERLLVDDDRLDSIAEGFADVVDAKSPWTFQHSQGVAEATVGILEQLGFDAPHVRYWRRAALLHDVGKLGVSNLILDKPGKLTDEEFATIKTHVKFTRRILHRAPFFSEFADVAAAHHERLDGRGYDQGLTGEELSTEARAIAVADVYDALSAKRPYRDRDLAPDEVFGIIDKQAGTALCQECVNALKVAVGYE